jgi:serine/threonine-protein kinase
MLNIEIPGYEILEKVGDGAMGVVFKARQRSLDRIVAVKVLRPELATDPTAMAQFRLEANSVAMLKHPNILMLHEAGQSNGLNYFIMEYVAAYSVASWLARKGVLAESDALTIADSVARALQYAWDKAGLIHCDLKPGNILVDEDGIIKIADFSGISRSNLSAEAQILREVTIGTPNYMSPEQVRGIEAIDFRVDIYSLGALLYHLVTGVLPFEHCTEAEAMQQQIDGKLTDPAELNPAVSVNFSILLEKMMVKDREQRAAGWDAVLADITNVRAGHPPFPPMAHPGASTILRTVQPPPPEPPRPKAPPVFAPPAPAAAPAPLPSTVPRPKSKKLPVLITAAVALVIADALLLFWPRIAPLWKRLRADRESGIVEPLPLIPPEAPAAKPEPVVPAPVAPRPVTPPPPATTNLPPPPAVTNVAPQPAPPPPMQPAPETDPAIAAGEARRAENLRTQLKLLQGAMAECTRRNYNGAIALLSDWSNANTGHPNQPLIETELTRIRSIVALYQMLESNSRALSGRPILNTPGVSGDILGIRGSKLTLARRLGEGSAQVDHDLYRLGSQDLLDFFQVCDPARFPLHAARLMLGEAQFTAVDAYLMKARAANLDCADLVAWLKDWQQVLLNIRADRAVDEIKARVQDSQFRAAGDLLASALQTYTESDIVRWARRDELQRLDALIRGETGESPAAAPGPATGETADLSGIEQFNVSELISRMRQLDGRVVRVRFRYRSAIDEAGPGNYATNLGLDNSTISAAFAQEGYRWFRNSVSQGYGGDNPIRIVYGVVDAKRQSIRLLGRTLKRRIGGQGDEFSW